MVPTRLVRLVPCRDASSSKLSHSERRPNVTLPNHCVWLSLCHRMCNTLVHIYEEAQKQQQLHETAWQPQQGTDGCLQNCSFINDHIAGKDIL